jgi:lipoate-protein ligase A
MSIDLALLARAERKSESWLRLYQWAPHCLSFGRHEPALRRYDVHRILELGLDTVRRPTGGRAVWHASEPTYAVAAPLTRFGSPSQAYQEIHDLLRQTLSELGGHATLAPRCRTPSLDAGSCFASAAGGEVLIDGRKIVGSAQLCRGSALLQHGSILLEDQQEVVRGLSKDYADRAAVTPDLQGRPISRLDATGLSRAVAAAAADRWPGRWDSAPEIGTVLSEASASFPQFRSPEWTWIR